MIEQGVTEALNLPQVTGLTKGRWCRGIPASWGRLQFDTRNLQAGEVFLALQGKRDGHDYVAAAKAAGAVAALVACEIDCDLPQLVVADPQAALHELATWQRQQFAGEVILVTGSNGKSTTKAMLYSILAHWVGPAAVLASPGNRNNHIGLPLCLVDLAPQHEYAILEAGMNHSGEIALLAQLAQPDHGIITNAGRAHLGNFANVDEVASAKGELISKLREGGTIVLNADDHHFPTWRELAKRHEVIAFSHAGIAEAVCRRQPGRDFLFSFDGSAWPHEVNLQVYGAHNEQNALAAAAMAWRLGVPNTVICEGLEEFAGIPGRQEISLLHDLVLINDSYNASPESFEAALAALAARPEKLKILAMGDMLELGERAGEMHVHVMHQALSYGIQHVIAHGPLSEAAAKVVGASVAACNSKEELVAKVDELAQGSCAILVKGSRGMHMDEVLRELARIRA